MEHAIEIMFGTWLPIEEVEIAAEDTPESILLSKSMFEGMSQDCKILASLILNAPDDLFFGNGDLKHIEFRRYCRHKKNWSSRKVKALWKEITYFSRSMRI